MRIRLLWLVGLVCTLPLVAVSAQLGHRARLAAAEASPRTQGAPKAAQRSTPESSRTDGNPTMSGDYARDRTIHLNFRHVDILQIIPLISELTGRNFLVDDKVRGYITLIAPQPVTRAEA